VGRFFILILLAMCAGPLLYAQPDKSHIDCYAERGKNNLPQTRKLWDGYEISLGPARNGQVDDSCTAAIYNRAGKVVYRTTGFNVIFDQDQTGEDFDGDGHPEVVFKTDTGGGNHCCWAYNVISLWPRPHKLADIAQAGAVDFRKNKDGKMFIWSMEPGPYGYTSMAENPFAQKVYTVGGGKLLDVTPDFCPAIVTGADSNYAEAIKHLPPERLAKFKAGMDADSDESRETVSGVLSVALQHLFCRQFDQAIADLDSWPEATKAKMKTDFANQFREQYPEFAARLTGQAKPVVQPLHY
jgi:hypothetical protein